MIMGSNSAFWDERFNLLSIARVCAAAAAWPIAAFFLVQSLYIRWPSGEKLIKIIEENDAEIKKLKDDNDRLRVLLLEPAKTRPLAHSSLIKQLKQPNTAAEMVDVKIAELKEAINNLMNEI